MARTEDPDDPAELARMRALVELDDALLSMGIPGECVAELRTGPKLELLRRACELEERRTPELLMRHGHPVELLALAHRLRLAQQAADARRLLREAAERRSPRGLARQFLQDLAAAYGDHPGKRGR